MSDDHNEFFKDGLITMPMLTVSAQKQHYAERIQDAPYTTAMDAIEHLRDHPNLENLKKLDQLSYELDRALTDCVHKLRVIGATWETIGLAFKISRQAAQQRFGIRQ